MKGQPRCCASMRPSVDLPAPRSPTSAMRRARSAPLREATRAAMSLVTAELGGARTLLRQQRGRGKIERLGDGAQHADRRIAGATLDLRQITLRGLGGLRQLPAR